MNPRMSGMAEVALGSENAGRRPQGGHVGVEPADLLGRQVQVVHTQLPGLAQDVVVHVGHVAHALGVVAEVAQAALQDVVGQIGGGVTQVGGVVGGDPAGVHLHHRSGLEGNHPPSGGVVEVHGAGHSVPAGRAQRSPGLPGRSGSPVIRTAAWVL